MASSITQLRYHIVWATKYRYALLDDFVVPKLKEYLELRQEKWGYQIVSCAIEPDHVHLLIDVQPDVNLTKLIGKLKGGSSKSLRQRFKKLMIHPSLWTPSHFCGTVGSVSEETVKEYLANQGLKEKETVQRTFVYKVLYSQRKFRWLKRYLRGTRTKDKQLAPSAMIQNADSVKNTKTDVPLRNDLVKVEPGKDQKSNYWLRVPGGKSCGIQAFWIGLCGRQIPPDARICDSTIKIVGKKVEVHLVIEQERIIQRAKPDCVVAIDLGVCHPVTSVALKDGKVQLVEFSGKSVKKHAYKREQRDSKLKSKGIQETGPYLETYNKRVSDDIHQMTHKIVEQAKHLGASIIVGNIHGISYRWRKGQMGKAFRKQARGVPYGRIMTQLLYKATLENIPLCFVDEAYTSQTCYKCSHCEPANRNGAIFRCKNCNHEIQSDANGAINIGTMALARHLRCCDSSFGAINV